MKPKWKPPQGYRKGSLGGLNAEIPEAAFGIFVICGENESPKLVFPSNDLRTAIHAVLDDARIREAMKVSTEFYYKLTDPLLETERDVEVEGLREQFIQSDAPSKGSG